MTSTTPAPATSEEVLLRYQDLRALHQQRYDDIASRIGNIFRDVAAVIVFILFQTYRSMHGHSSGLLITGFVAIVALVWYMLRERAKLDREQRLLVFYDRNLLRADGTETQSGRTGIEPGQDLRVPGHLYEHDLDLLGPDSLFGLLATVRTGIGERGLARYLLEPATHEETLQRQASVKELLPQTDLREQIALLGASRFQQITASFFDTWLDEAPPVIHPLYRIALLITVLINLGLLAAGLFHLMLWSDVFTRVALVLCVQAALSLVLRERVLPLLTASTRLQQHVHLIADGLALMQAATFDTPKLKELQRASLEPTGAVKLLKRLENQLTIVEQRAKEWYFVLSLLPRRRYADRHLHRQLETQSRRRHAPVARRLGRVRSPQRPRHLRLRASGRHMA